MKSIQNLPIAARLAILGGLLLVATVVVGVGGWHGLRDIHQLEIRSAQESAAYAQAMDTARVAQVDFKKQVQEWKDLLLRGGDPAMFAKYKSAFTQEAATVASDLARLKAQMQALGTSTQGVDAALATQATLDDRYLAALALYDSKDPGSAHRVDTQVKGMDRAPTDAIDGLVAGMKHDMSATSQRIDAASAQAYRRASFFLLAVLLCALLSGGCITWALARSITVPIHRAVKVAKAVADGDLSTEITHVTRDETGMLLGALKDMNGQLRRVVAAIRDGSSEISSSTRQIASGNMDLSSRTNEQAAALQETAASMQQFAHSASTNAVGAREASQLAESATLQARQTHASMREAQAMMGRVHDASQRIAQITQTIDAIAMQTHILSLNAAVEAARAGQASQGFNVVAAEVRELATHSKQASGDIRKLVEETGNIIDESQHVMRQAGDLVTQLLDNVTHVAATVGHIASQSADQSHGVQQVNHAVRQMDEVTQSNAALVEEAAAAADAVQVRARSLVESVAFFRLDRAA
ncbi:methyl-accepting chemotaxis protein [Dyella sp.]|uniref:methyl-accepting chemotaxis protein n=1 Tax=Dyella sp. TaxID=1869338 RepID=UPI002ED383B8